MAKLRRILALVLVMAMTFSMLPVFASADDAVSEVAAVETVEAPAAEAPVAEAPAAEPVVDIPTAVEDVAEIPAETPADVPVVDAIETAPTEAVAALQDVSADSVAKVVKYNANKEVIEETGYATVKEAYVAAGKFDGLCEIVLLKDVTYVLKSGTSASSGYLNGATATRAGYLSWDLDNELDEEVKVKGFWMDMNGHTLTVRCVNTSTNNKGYYNPAFFLGDSVPFNLKNGTVIYKYSRTTQSNGFSILSMGYTGTANGTYAIGTADRLYEPTATLKDVNLLRVHNSGDLADGGTYANAGPVISVAFLASNIRMIRSDLFTTGGYGIFYNKNEYKNVAPAGITEVSHNLVIEDSRFGTAATDKPAIYAGSVVTSDTGGLDVETTNLNVTLKGAVQLIGSDTVVASAEGPTVNFAAREQMTDSSTMIAVPDVASILQISATSETVPAYLSPKEYDSFLYLDNTHEHVLLKQEAVPATITANGLKEHYTCKFCNAYYEADGVTPTTLEALTLTLSDLSDKELADLGVVAVAVDPDGTTHCYTGNSAIKDAYTYGAQNWEESGGVVRLVTDFTYVSIGTRSADSVIDGNVRTKDTNKSYTYKNADNPDINGFWFDLGGHTLVFRSKAPMFGPRYSLPVNVRNGNIVYDNQATNSTSTYGCIKNGTTAVGMSSETEVYCPVYTFDGVTFIRVDSTYTAGPIFHNAAFQSEINLIDSTFINNDGSHVIAYEKTSAAMKCTAEGVSKAYKHVVNLKGNTVIGNSTGIAIYCKSAGNEIEGDPDCVTINNDATVTFLGTGIATFANADLASKSSTPSGYVVSENKYEIQLPDITTAAGETTPGAGVEKMVDSNGDPVMTQISMLEKQSDTTLCATFTPNGGEASEEMTLSAAFRAWESNNFSGKITLTADVSEEDSAKAVSVLNCSSSYNRTYSSSTTISITTNPLYAPTSEANNGDLTLDLGDNTLALKVPVLVLDNELENFDLTIKNGTITSSGTAPALILKGSGGKFKLDNATLANTHETANFPYAIHDSRYANSYSILTDSTLSSAHGAAIAMMTTSANQTDASLLYYIKDCTLNAAVVSTYSPAAISSLTSLAGSVYRPTTNVILDGTTVNCDKITNYSANSLLTVTAPEAEATPAATVAYGELISISCADAAEAVKAAELLSRNASAAATVTLQSDSVVTASKPVGVAGVESTFTLDLNGKALTGEGLLEANGGAGTKVTMNVIGELGGDATKVKFFAHADALDYTAGSSYVIEKGRYFTKYSLNLEDSVSINLYTDGENGNADSVTYVHDGNDYKATAGNLNEWVVTTLAAKDMDKTVDAYAVKNEGNATYLDFSKGMSVKSYVASDPGATETDETILGALERTLDSMIVYGEYAKKYFNNDFEEISNMNSLIGKDVLDVDTSNLVHVPREVSAEIPNHAADNALPQGYWGTSAVLEDNISIKMYFYGAMFDGATAKVKYGDGDFEDATLETQDSTGFKFIKSAVAAKDFDTAITVALYKGDTLIGTVTDSVESYTTRINDGENAYRLAQALRAYGADAKRYDEAKNAN